MTINDEDLESILAGGESFRVEFKETFDGSTPTTVREAVCAFANDLPASDKPGVIFIGVKDNGQLAGIQITDQLLLKLTDIKTDGNIVPPPSLFVEMRVLKGAKVAVITVFPSDSPPVRYKGAIHVRSGPRKEIATAQDERILNEKRRHKNLPFDIHPVPDVGLSELNTRQFEDEYLISAFNAEVLEQNERSLNQRLAATKMISSADDSTATILGLLIIGKRPLDYVNNSYIQFLRIDGTDLADGIIDEEVITGTIAEILCRLDEKMKAQIHTRINITDSDKEQRSESYPLAALQQIARNAIMHRTYEATSAPVRIVWFNDRIEILSPGGPYGVVTQNNFGKPGMVDYRNPNIAEAMKVMGYVQRFGVGIANARRLLSEAGHPKLEFFIDDNFVQAIIRGRKS